MSSKILAIISLASLLAGCAVATVQSQLAPNTSITKSDPLFLEIETTGSIAYQKYTATLKDAVEAAGINVVTDKSAARYVMSINIKEFPAPIALSVPDVKTTVVSGNVGTVPVSGTASTYSTRTTHTTIPTHNSDLIVTDARNGRIIWTGLLAKSGSSGKSYGK
ncbi:MAG: hypothetical protein OHM77_09875 [Candidatus Nitricoxidivorans perseverans]|uniref:DUF4136 domain-containing protein n=1 Tax=Candidatus Nitricoxidivorans perseverans TaxID=2975601 RepID=A0AA49FJS6_9PROT|nr:MAG: hypothetical protein OHM77_09875 [Candidatus Nitricoxidivorans perseverans]